MSNISEKENSRLRDKDSSRHITDHAMSGKERMLKTLRFEEPDRPPHFEIMFELEKKAFGLQFPDRNAWADCSPNEKGRMIGTCMAIYSRIVEKYQWDALAVYWPWGDPDGVKAAKKCFGNTILIGSLLSETVWSIDAIKDWDQFSLDLFEHPERIHEQARHMTSRAIENIDRLLDAGADFVYLANDVGFNGGPFISPKQFAEIVTPYLAQQVQRIKNGGAFAFVHSDGMIMPVLEEILSTEPHLLQSIDPMAGMDIAEVKKITHNRTALMGNVQCNLLQDGPREAIRESALYCLEHASPGGGYVFSTSNTIYPGMPLDNYEFMLSVYHNFNEEKR